MHHHFRSLGGWTFAFNDYIALNITAYVDDPRMQNLMDIVDPYCKSSNNLLAMNMCLCVCVSVYVSVCMCV